MRGQSHIDRNGKPFVACHECEFGGNGSFKSCNVGRDITRSTYDRGCPAGVVIEGVEVINYEVQVDDQGTTTEQ